MRKPFGLAVSAAVVVLLTFGVALAETPDELRNRILTQTKVVAVPELLIPVAEYKSDGDPDTLEIVFLTKKSDGPSRVSDDGEVIFLYQASDKVQQELISRAFQIRIARASSGT